ncbi:unnamed protein product, partial [Phaeothamnion confervicola]
MSEGGCTGCGCGTAAPGKLEGTLEAYTRHAVICSGQSQWPAKIEAEEGSVAQALSKSCIAAGLIPKKHKGSNKEKAAAADGAGAAAANHWVVRLTACAEESTGPTGTTDVLVYPGGRRYRLRGIEDVEPFVAAALAKGEDYEAAAVADGSAGFKNLVLVCTHGERDKRCGRAGPQVVAELEAAKAARGITDAQVVVRGCSHLGGHKYAGVCVVLPSGDWYGELSKRNAAKILDRCVGGPDAADLRNNWRGNM